MTNFKRLESVLKSQSDYALRGCDGHPLNHRMKKLASYSKEIERLEFLIESGKGEL